ncbi:hypothetical protein KP509_15G068400 [Ceratopteris richardii]|uniref:Uncharacterized protein n=1 Tax=Ceratopteris richardii TaxID=49495 RepID=A0A8T2T885_CERRI|nr:hypothetical protein KP509_15G068400 [Ceratopteris richardii]
MNLSLLDPFQADFPELIEEYLERGHVKCISFNRRGTLLAAGCTDGACVIWDFHTRGVAKELRDTSCSASISSVNWTKNGRYLLVAAADRSLVLWDVANGTKLHTATLEQPALSVRLNPKNSSLCLACPIFNAPYLVDLESGSFYTLPVSVEKLSESGNISRLKSVSGNAQFCPSVACFDKTGDTIFIGSSKGEVIITDIHLTHILGIVIIPGGAIVRSFSLSRSGQYLLIVSNDRIIRLYEVSLPADTAIGSFKLHAGNRDDISLEHLKQLGYQRLKYCKDFQDRVDRVQWKAACFSGDSKYIAGASALKGEHKIHIWNSKTGDLVRILEGPKEGLADLAWHPNRPIMASISLTVGVIYIWAKNYTESWSAFAPDFQELEENEEYIEREDEFDLMPDIEEPKTNRHDDGEDQNEEVDIMTADRVAAFSESDDSDDGLYFLPMLPSPDTPEQQNQAPQASQIFEGSNIGSPLDSEYSNGADGTKTGVPGVSLLDKFSEERHMDRQRKRKWGLIEKMEGNPFQKDSLLNGYLKSERRVMIPSSQATTNSLLDND